MEILHPKLWVVGSSPTCRVSPAVAQMVEQKSKKPPSAYSSSFQFCHMCGEWCRERILLKKIVGSNPIECCKALVAQMAGHSVVACSFADFLEKTGKWCSERLLRFGNERSLVRIQPACLFIPIGESPGRDTQPWSGPYAGGSSVVER